MGQKDIRSSTLFGSDSNVGQIKRKFECESGDPTPVMKMKLEEKVKTCGEKEEYPRFSKLGAKYLAVLASSTPAERAMSKMDLILNKKRLKLTSSHFAMLMFLSDTVK